MKKPTARFLLVTWNPDAPFLSVPVGTAHSEGEAKTRYRGLLARLDGWKLAVVDAWNGYAWTSGDALPAGAFA